MPNLYGLTNGLMPFWGINIFVIVLYLNSRLSLLFLYSVAKYLQSDEPVHPQEQRQPSMVLLHSAVRPVGYKTRSLCAAEKMEDRGVG